MKHVVSVSLGSNTRDHKVEITLAGERLLIERRGTDGDLEAAENLIRQLDGQVDAIGLGGINIALYVAGQRYAIRDGERLAAAATRTPVVDGSGLKNSLERDAVRGLVEKGLLQPGAKVLMVVALDRFGMAESLVEAGVDVTFGDIMFTTGMDYPVHSLDELARLAARTLPALAKLPFAMLYPTGRRQEQAADQKFARYYQDAAWVAGDFHEIRRYLPDDVAGASFLTNTTTASDVRLLKRCGAHYLCTSTPQFMGRSFGANVMEAALRCLVDGPALDDRGLGALAHRVGLVPRLRDLFEEEPGDE